MATNNADKVREVNRIIQPFGHRCVGLKEIGLQLNVDETGDTYAKNALLKAMAAYRLTERAILADDSGLEVDALDGAPGIKSARFAGDGATSQQNNDKLLYLLERTPYSRRTAQFVCAMVLVDASGRVTEAHGRCPGVIGFEPQGEHGFGYDPLFYHKGKSFATLTDEEKDTISHRGIALRQLMQTVPTDPID